MNLPRHMANARLEPGHIPQPDASWEEISRFALTFDGYSYWGSFERCAEIANSRHPSTLTELRTCLFFEQRRWRHSGEDPDQEALQYIHELVSQIRARVAQRLFD
jgi:hypothetical protein